MSFVTFPIATVLPALCQLYLLKVAVEPTFIPQCESPKHVKIVPRLDADRLAAFEKYRHQHASFRVFRRVSRFPLRTVLLVSFLATGVS
jgi:hypothetical protein